MKSNYIRVEGAFKMTRKTRLFLALHTAVRKLDFFCKLDQWLLRNCDMEEKP